MGGKLCSGTLVNYRAEYALYDFDNGQKLSFDRAIDMKSKNLAGSLIFVYSPTKRLEFGVISNAGKNDLSSAELANTFYTNASSVLDSTIRANAPANDKTNERGLTAYAEYKFDSLGKKITLTYNNSLNENATTKNIGSELYYPTIDSTKFNELDNTGDIKYGINSSMLDVELPYSFAKIETGFSYTRINNNSLLQFENQNNDNTKTISNDAFDYYEHTAGVYASIEKPFNKLSAKLGLRYERSTIEGNSQSMNLNNRSNYDKLFPTVNISYVGLRDNILSLTYSKRIQRPNFFYLNPFRYYTSPYAFTSGNASLQPAFIDNVELLHIFKNSLTTIASYSRTANGISYVSLYQDGYNYSISQNNFTQNKLNFNVIYQKSILSWWAINPVLELYHSKNRSTAANVGLVDQKGFGGMMIVSNTFTIRKLKNIFLQANYYQFFPSQTDFQKTKAFGFFNSNIRFLLKHALQCTISYSDIFGTNRTVYTQRYNDYLFTNSFNPHAQNVSVSFSYLFGNKKVNSEYRQSKNAEKGRTYK